jgi:hypothetical protein
MTTTEAGAELRALAEAATPLCRFDRCGQPTRHIWHQLPDPKVGARL